MRVADISAASSTAQARVHRQDVREHRTRAPDRYFLKRPVKARKERATVRGPQDAHRGWPADAAPSCRWCRWRPGTRASCQTVALAFDSVCVRMSRSLLGVKVRCAKPVASVADESANCSRK